jgi:hypothetical protein
MTDQEKQEDQADQEPMVVRELLPQELSALRAVPPFDQFEGLGEHALRHVRVMGAIRGEGPSARVVAYWMVFDAVHVEPLWIADEERGNPGIARPLWEGIRRILDQIEAPMAFAIVGDGGLAQNLPMMVRLGFKPLQGNLFYLNTAEAKGLRQGGQGGNGG